MSAAYRSDLIIDAGMFDGTDSAYYLHKGFRVIAIDADPIACQKAHVRFQKQISNGQLEVLNIGIAEQASELTFYRNLLKPEASSFIIPESVDSGSFEEITVACLSMQSIIEKYGIPYYLKIDLEGRDNLALQTLAQEIAPPYISTELNFGHDPFERLESLGYRAFKLINQECHTQNYDMPRIGEDEVLLRALRKAGRWMPPLRSIIRALPSTFRRRNEWERPHYPDDWRPDSPWWSGPFAEQTHGEWMDLPEARKAHATLQAHFTGTWWDVHARRAG